MGDDIKSMVMEINRMMDNDDMIGAIQGLVGLGLDLNLSFQYAVAYAAAGTTPPENVIEEIRECYEQRNQEYIDQTIDYIESKRGEIEEKIEQMNQRMENNHFTENPNVPKEVYRIGPRPNREKIIQKEEITDLRIDLNRHEDVLDFIERM